LASLGAYTLPKRTGNYLPDDNSSSNNSSIRSVQLIHSVVAAASTTHIRPRDTIANYPTLRPPPLLLFSTNSRQPILPLGGNESRRPSKLFSSASAVSEEDARAANSVSNNRQKEQQQQQQEKHLQLVAPTTKNKYDQQQKITRKQTMKSQ
jgi:hypothetical protein